MTSLLHELRTLDPAFWIIGGLVALIFVFLKLAQVVEFRRLEPVGDEGFAAEVLKQYDVDKDAVLKARARLAGNLHVPVDRLAPKMKASEMAARLGPFNGMALDDLRADYEVWCRENGVPREPGRQTVADLVYFMATTGIDSW